MNDNYQNQFDNNEQNSQNQDAQQPQPPQYQPPQQYQQYQQYQQPAPNPPLTGTPGFGTASMILGIVAVVLSCIYYLSLPCAIVGLILGIVSLKRGTAGKKMAIAGIITSSISFILVVVWLFIIGMLVLSSDFFYDYYYDLMAFCISVFR